jgi:hypothetical protein
VASATFIRTLKWWFSTGRITLEYVESLVPSKITEEDAQEITG